jgi:serine/tyrosine/threonine adenylyltransferase
MSRNASPRFDNSYSRLPAAFYSRQAPTPVRSPALVRVNHALAGELGLSAEWLESAEGLAVLSGNSLAPGSDPIATAYAGHQFGGWNPRLGDGRAILLGEIIGLDGQRYDLQLKGAGRTPYARGGDGRSPLGPVLREYLIAEAMAVLGVPTSRALAAVTTGEQVYRDTPQPGGILTRIASSHIRIGTFQFFAGQGDADAVRALADHVLARHYPECLESERPYLELLRAVIRRQARLIAQWMQLGFIHGVMNTDNMLISGETIDYGPCAFMDRHDPATVYSSIDTGGRYAYANQPGIGQWNLAWLARVLLPLIDQDQDTAVGLAQSAIDEYVGLYQDAHAELMAAKLGFPIADQAARELVDDLLKLMTTQRSDHTLTFRRLAELAGPAVGHSVADLIELAEPFTPWLERWLRQLEIAAPDAAQRQARMLALNPAFIPRNHLVEEVIRAAVDCGNVQPFHRLADRLARPFDYEPEDARYATPPAAGEEVLCTFCGT